MLERNMIEYQKSATNHLEFIVTCKDPKTFNLFKKYLTHSSMNHQELEPARDPTEIKKESWCVIKDQSLQVHLSLTKEGVKRVVDKFFEALGFVPRGYGETYDSYFELGLFTLHPLNGNKIDIVQNSRVRSDWTYLTIEEATLKNLRALSTIIPYYLPKDFPLALPLVNIILEYADIKTAQKYAELICSAIETQKTIETDHYHISLDDQKNVCIKEKQDGKCTDKRLVGMNFYQAIIQAGYEFEQAVQVEKSKPLSEEERAEFAKRCEIM